MGNFVYSSLCKIALLYITKNFFMWKMFYFNIICRVENKKGRAAVGLPFECISFKLLWRKSASLQVTVIHINISKYTVNRAPVSNRNCGRLSPMLLTPPTYEKLFEKHKQENNRAFQFEIWSYIKRFLLKNHPTVCGPTPMDYIFQLKSLSSVVDWSSWVLKREAWLMPTLWFHLHTQNEKKSV